MRCFKCKKLSLEPICKDCEKLYLIPTPINKKVGALDVISIFNYYSVSEFIKSKYHLSGYKIYKFLAKKYINPTLKEYLNNQPNKIYLIGVDESFKREYSLISLLMHYGAKDIKPLKIIHSALEAKNKVSYAGKSLEFRLKNPRDFKYNGPKNIKAILIDDLITTGTTLQEAYILLQKYNISVEFALTLANVDKGIDY